jgi:hypothetical protein
MKPFDFKPIATAPTPGPMQSAKQILVRFKGPQDRGWYYYVAEGYGVHTHTPGYARPEEWCELPED